MYRNDPRTVVTLDAGGTNFVFSAMRGYRSVVEPLTLPANAHDLDLCLQTMVEGFSRVIARLPYPPVAISFAFPGPADYRRGIIGGYLPNFPSFRAGVALGPFLSERFGLPVFINNDGDLYALGEALGGALPEINREIEALGGARRYSNLLGYTLGTGLGVGSVIDGRLNLGNNSCVETFCLPSPRHPGIIAEDDAAIRSVVRDYAEVSGESEPRTPLEIFGVAEGTRQGDPAAAREAFARLGEVVGDVAATAVTLTDSLVVIGGGLTGAMRYIKPALLARMRSTLQTLTGETLGRLQMEVFDLDDPEEFRAFAAGAPQQLKVYGSERTVPYDPVRRTGVMTSRLGAPAAISLGAYAYALQQLEF